MNPLDVFLAMLRARSASTRSKGFLCALLICGELSKFNMKKRGVGRDKKIHYQHFITINLHKTHSNEPILAKINYF